MTIRMITERRNGQVAGKTLRFRADSSRIRPTGRMIRTLLAGLLGIAAIVVISVFTSCVRPSPLQPEPPVGKPEFLELSTQTGSAGDTIRILAANIFRRGDSTTLTFNGEPALYLWTASDGDFWMIPHGASTGPLIVSTTHGSDTTSFTVRLHETLVQELQGHIFHDMVWDGTKIISVGDVVATSVDCHNFQIELALNSPATSIVESGGTYVFAGSNTLGVSTDGHQWTIVDTPIHIRDLAYGQSEFVAVGGGRILKSTDGRNWTEQRTDFGTGIHPNLTSVSYTSGRYVAVGSTGSGSLVASSPDGDTWTSCQLPYDCFITDIASNGQTFVAVGDSAFVSNDGISNWSICPGLPTNRSMARVIWSGRQFVAIDATNGIRVSADCREWINYQGRTASNYRAICWAGDRFVAMGNGIVAEN